MGLKGGYLGLLDHACLEKLKWERVGAVLRKQRQLARPVRLQQHLQGQISR